MLQAVVAGRQIDGVQAIARTRWRSEIRAKQDARLREEAGIQVGTSIINNLIVSGFCR